MTTTTTTDRIEKQVQLRATRERVWQALTRSAEFGRWFGMRVEGEFAANTTVQARIVPTEVDPEIAAKQKGYADMSFELFIERVEPMSVFSFRWQPYAAAPGDAVPPVTTLVTFELADAEGGTLLTVSESGFDRIPIERRAKAFADNEGGWEMQTTLIAKYLARADH